MEDLPDKMASNPLTRRIIVPLNGAFSEELGRRLASAKQDSLVLRDSLLKRQARAEAPERPGEKPAGDDS